MAALAHVWNGILMESQNWRIGHRCFCKSELSGKRFLYYLEVISINDVHVVLGFDTVKKS